MVEITSQLYCNCWWLGGGKGLVVLQQGRGEAEGESGMSEILQFCPVIHSVTEHREIFNP